jgi:predicted PurR-regulated permease PerM
VGAPVNRRSPFVVAFVATLGVLLALLLARAVQLVSATIVLIVVAGFLAIGLNPAVEFLLRRGWSRGRAAAVVMGGVLLFFGGFVAAAVPPVVAQVSELQEDLPGRLEDLRSENATFKRLDARYGLLAKAEAAVEQQANTRRQGLRAGARSGHRDREDADHPHPDAVLHRVVRPHQSAARCGWSASRRPRVGLLLDEILARVGGYVLGNLATSLVAGVVSFVWFLALGIPYPLALALLLPSST